MHPQSQTAKSGYSHMRAYPEKPRPRYTKIPDRGRGLQLQRKGSNRVSNHHSKSPTGSDRAEMYPSQIQNPRVLGARFFWGPPQDG